MDYSTGQSRLLQLQRAVQPPHPAQEPELPAPAKRPSKPRSRRQRHAGKGQRLGSCDVAFDRSEGMCAAERRARRRAKVGAKPKLRTKAPPEQSVEAGAIVVQAEHLAHEAAACKEAWDARAAVRLLRQSAALMESANAARKQLRRAANEVLQVLDVEDPKTRSLVGDALRTFGVQ
ncbi:hypothetical protein AK812_SmicGene12570 [Symbiodinium microadriaticum]|uniref:Uncharacterized protein n=1 Tax=Symbiodinium microadriaticum TaxID=2951 RepID=A0A1Q9EA70_SYMMI|nr:hypothetical protein AK812_SmicGene12570 [Symbiodinium microadriaticum]